MGGACSHLAGLPSKRLLHLRQQLIRLQIKRPWLRAYEAAKQSSRRSQTVADKSLRMPRSCYGKLRLYLAGVLDCGGAKTLQECDEEIFKTEEEIAEIVKRPSLLPSIFLTFRDAEAANRIIEAAEDRAYGTAHEGVTSRRMATILLHWKE